MWAAFLGRLVDLTLRWSINNSTKSLLWIATPREMQVRAKPIIEGTVKKMTGSCTAFCIGVVSVILVGDHKLRALALLSAAVAAASSVVCASSGRMYHAAMWAQIDRRELVLDEDADRARQYGSSGLVDFEGTIEIDPVMAAMVLEKLQSAPPQAQLCPGGDGGRVRDASAARPAGAALHPARDGRAAARRRVAHLPREPARQLRVARARGSGGGDPAVRKGARALLAPAAA